MTKDLGKYNWLNKEPGPLAVLEGIKLLGTKEVLGSGNNPIILSWAREIAKKYPTPYNLWAGKWYNKDEIPWCGLGMAIMQVRAGRAPVNNYLSALAWASYGHPLKHSEAALGDVLTFTRKGGGHVALYIAEDDKAFHILGANQADAFSIVRKAKSELYAVNRPPYRNTPRNVRKIFVNIPGALSKDEA